MARSRMRSGTAAALFPGPLSVGSCGAAAGVPWIVPTEQSLVPILAGVAFALPPALAFPWHAVPELAQKLSAVPVAVSGMVILLIAAGRLWPESPRTGLFWLMAPSPH